jgi:hypothetical protein
MRLPIQRQTETLEAPARTPSRIQKRGRLSRRTGKLGLLFGQTRRRRNQDLPLGRPLGKPPNNILRSPPTRARPPNHQETLSARPFCCNRSFTAASNALGERPSNAQDKFGLWESIQHLRWQPGKPQLGARNLACKRRVGICVAPATIVCSSIPASHARSRP